MSPFNNLEIISDSTSAVPARFSKQTIISEVIPTGVQAYNMEIRGNIAYIADWTDGFTIIDFSDPGNPVKKNIKFDSNPIFNLTIKDNYIYL